MSTSHLPLLRTRNLLLRPAIQSDAPQLAALFSNPLNTRHEPHKPRSPTTGEYQRRILKWDELRAAGSACFLVVTKTATPEASEQCPDDDTVVGFGGINAISTDESGKRTADLGILIDSSMWRKGYGREALETTVEYAFRGQDEGGCGCEEVLFETLAVNAAFQQLVGRLGLAKWKVVKSDGRECEYRFSKGNWEVIKRNRG